MIFWRADWHEDEPTAQNCEWFTNKRDAVQCARECGGSAKLVNVPTDKAGLLIFLNRKLWRA